MLTETSELTGLEVYTQNGLMLGAVEDLVFDAQKQKVYGLFIERTNPVLVEGSTPVVQDSVSLQGFALLVRPMSHPDRKTVRPTTTFGTVGCLRYLLPRSGAP